MNEDSPPDEVVRFETDFSTVERHPGGLVVFTAKAGEHTLEHAQQATELVGEICREEGRKVRVLVDMRASRKMGREARQVYESPEYTANVVGIALMVDSGISRVLGNFFIGLSKGDAPSRLFTSMEDAREWLESLPDR